MSLRPNSCLGIGIATFPGSSITREEWFDQIEDDSDVIMLETEMASLSGNHIM